MQHCHHGRPLLKDNPLLSRVPPGEIARVIIVGLAWIWSIADPIPHYGKIDVVALVAVLIGGWPIYKHALGDLFRRRMTMELSMTIALFAALAAGETAAALAIAFFVLISEILEKMTVEKGRRAIEDLISLLPQEAFVRIGDEIRKIAIEEVTTGSVVVVRPGDRVPVDGDVIVGRSYVDEAAITGEPMPAQKAPGSRIFAGTINQTGVIEIRTSERGRATAFGRIIETVEAAEKSKAPVERLADKLAAIIVIFSFTAAALTYALTRDVTATISVIIVAGACGVAAGTPLAILGAIGRAARAGAIIKGGVHLEMLAKADTIVLDKTGTLTLGRPRVLDIHPLGNATAETLMDAAALAEQNSSHPLAEAILEKARSMNILPREGQDAQIISGKGITCRDGNSEIIAGSRAFLESRGCDTSAAAAHEDPASEVLIARDRRILGAIHIADEIRPESVEAVRAMRALGLDVILLTGDAPDVADSIAKKIGVTNVRSRLLPEEKMIHVRELRQRGKRIAMVGDGINDAPALAEADIGVAMGSGTDIARECADIVLIGNDLGKFVETIQTARHARGIIMQNFYGTIAVDIVGMILAGIGIVGPILAAFIHVSSELLFILNSARLISLKRS